MFPGETVMSGCKLATKDDFKVMRSGGGWYVGTTTNGMPCTRETDYFRTEDEAASSLEVFKETGVLKGQRR